METVLMLARMLFVHFKHSASWDYVKQFLLPVHPTLIVVLVSFASKVNVEFLFSQHVRLLVVDQMSTANLVNA